MYRLYIVDFEIAVARLLDANQNRRNLAQTETTGALASLQSVAEVVFSARLNGLAEVTDVAKHCF